MKNRLKKTLSLYKREKEELIPILQKIQSVFGYLSEEAMVEVAKYIRVPESAVYAVATFYAQFRFAPLGKQHIMVCRGTACHVRGASRILDMLEKELEIKEGEVVPDRSFSLETVACIGACGLAPNITINKKTHGHLTEKKLYETLKNIRSKKRK
jgi:NADH-quinone oxidoreductase subunit E